MELQLLHTADIHLDWLFERYNRESREQRRKEVAERFRRIVDIALERDVKALLLAGDIFHGEGIAESTFQFFRVQLERLANRRIWTLITPGNHDPLVDGSYWTRRRFPEYTKIFTKPTWECFSEFSGLEIWGIPFIPANQGRSVMADLPAANSAALRIAIVHGQIIEGQANERYYPIVPGDIEGKNLAYIALGHVHKPRTLQWGPTRVVYPGSPTRLTFKETSERGLTLITIRDDSLTTEGIAMPDREYRRVEIDLNQTEFDQLYQLFQAWRDPSLCLKVILTGVVEEEGGIIADAIAREFKSAFFHLEVDDQTIVMPSYEEYRTISDRFVGKIARQLQDPTIQNEERIALKYALQYGLAALKGAGRH
jgi:exonuclease SbcD